MHKTYDWFVLSFWLYGIYVISNFISPQMLISRQAFSCFISYNVTTFDIPALWKTIAISIFNERFFTTCFIKITQRRRKSFYLLSNNVSISKNRRCHKKFPLFSSSAYRVTDIFQWLKEQWFILKTWMRGFLFWTAHIVII